MNEKQARAIVYERSNGICEVMVPGVCRGRATNYQHRKNRSQCSRGERWMPENGLHVCGTGTTGCHGWIHANPEKSYANGWMVKAALDPRQVPVRYRGQAKPQMLESDGTVRPATNGELINLLALGMGVQL